MSRELDALTPPAGRTNRESAARTEELPIWASTTTLHRSRTSSICLFSGVESLPPGGQRLQPADGGGRSTVRSPEPGTPLQRNGLANVRIPYGP